MTSVTKALELAIRVLYAEGKPLRRSAVNDIQDALPLFIPIALIHLALAFFAVRDIIVRRTEKGPLFKGIWAIISVCIVVTGPLVYYYYARGEKSWSHRVTEAQRRMQEDALANKDKKDK